MFDLGWSELLLIGIVALIVVGPKDLPVMFRTMGKVTARLRAMARDFTRALEDAADDSGVRDVTKDLRKVMNPKAMGIDALKNAVDFNEIDPFGERRKASPAHGASESPELSESDAERISAEMDEDLAAHAEDERPSSTDLSKTERA